MSKTVSASVEEMTSEPPMVTGSTPEPTSPMSSTTPPPPKKYVYCVTGDRLTNDHALTSGFCDVAIYSGFVRIRNELKPGLGSYSWQVFRQAIKKGNFTAGISIVVPWPDGPKTVTEHFDKLEQSLMDLNKNENIMAFGFLDIDYEIMNITGTIKDAYKLRNHSATMANAFLQPPAHFEHGDNPQQAWEDWKEAHTIYEQAFEYATKPAATKKKPPVFSKLHPSTTKSSGTDCYLVLPEDCGKAEPRASAYNQAYHQFQLSKFILGQVHLKLLVPEEGSSVLRDTPA
ncbi:hypothetical protein HPB49_017947 [Dermacentor silvarum]|uniref:Uncharacterized protein n=1 Tax=Dermacentor silvarum TaxID=543639 RepID=A0ACB8C4T5_DERSI|nr:hypothetical protein HPB49_017947 [Dermacentor silvarum]